MSEELNRVEAGLLAWFAREFPGREALRVTGISTPAAGASNDTLLFDLGWRQDGERFTDKLVARLQPEREGIFPEYDLVLQYRAMQRLQDTAVPVPRMIGLDAEGSTLGRPFYVMARVPGRYLADNPPYQMEGWLCTESPAARTDMWTGGIRAIAAVNRVDWQALGFSDLWDSRRWLSPLAQLLDDYGRFMAWAEARGRAYPKLHRAYEYLLATMPSDQPVALCWGDAKPPNLMFEGTRVSGVLDWEMVHLGNPVHDLAWWLVLDDSLTDGLGLPKLPGIPSRERLVDVWQESSGHSAAELDYYELLSTFQFAVIMLRVGTLLTARGFFPAEAEFDVNNNCTPLLDRQLAKYGLDGG